MTPKKKVPRALAGSASSPVAPRGPVRDVVALAPRAHGYPTIGEFFSGAYVAAALALGASGCGTPAQASTPPAAVATLAPAKPVAVPTPSLATLVPLPLPPPPPLPGQTQDLPCSTPPDPLRPPTTPRHVGGHIAAVHPFPPATRGGMRTVNPGNDPADIF